MSFLVGIARAAMNAVILAWSSALLILTQGACADGLEAEGREAAQIEYQVYLSRWAGDIKGYLQTPDGGMPGRTDRHRPTFAELGIETADREVAGMHINVGHHQFLLESQRMRFEEELLLDAPLLSQWIQFDAGEAVKTQIKMDAWRFRYSQKREVITVPGLSFQPGAEIYLMDFHYRLFNTDKKVDRSYMKAGYRLGAAVNYAVSSRFLLVAEFYQSLPFPNTVDTTSLGIHGYYDLLPGDGELMLMVGVSHRKLRYKDEQEVPNNLVAETSPAINIGIRYTLGF
ncbi:MAG: hypothetical protein OEZ23_03030 [Gammaproteobacteria bacterium]|nr:hypothetical protein [Gammaproteobacteria bacterium]